MFGLIVAMLDTIFLAFTPVPVPLLWGLLAFITNYIPNIGFVVGLVPPAILGLLEGGPWLMVLIIAVYSVLNFIIQSVIQPKFVGDTVGLTGTHHLPVARLLGLDAGRARRPAGGAAVAAGQGAAGRGRPRLALAQPAAGGWSRNVGRQGVTAEARPAPTPRAARRCCAAAMTARSSCGSTGSS